MRWWDKVDGDNAAEDVAAASLLHLIEGLAPAVRNRTPIAGWVPEVVDGALDWDVEDDLTTVPGPGAHGVGP